MFLHVPIHRSTYCNNLNLYIFFHLFIHPLFLMLRRVTRRRLFHFFYSPCPSYLLKTTNRLLTFHIHHFSSYRHVPYPTCNIYNPPPPFTFGRLLNYLSYTSPVLRVSTPRRPLTDLCLAS